MKLNVAATLLASLMSMSVPSVSAVYSNAAGTCLSAVIANAGQQQDVDWSDEAAYYTIGNTNKNYYNANNNADDGEDGDEEEEGEREQEEEEEGADRLRRRLQDEEEQQENEEEEEEAEAEEAEYNIQTQMRSLAEALGLDYQEEGEDGENGNQQAFNYQELK